MCNGRVTSSCATNVTFLVTRVKNTTTSHERGKDESWPQQTEHPTDIRPTAIKTITATLKTLKVITSTPTYRVYGFIMTPVLLYFYWIGTKIYIVAYHHVDVPCVHHHFAKVRVKVRFVVLYNIDIKKSICVCEHHGLFLIVIKFYILAYHHNYDM